MLEAKLLVGRYLTLTVPPQIGPGAAAAFAPVMCPPLTIHDSTPLNPVTGFASSLRNRFGTRTSVAAPGINAAKTYRNFKWLPFHHGSISTTPLNHDVLTGPMSGCPLVRFRQNGVILAGHIGTVLGNVAGNAAVKAVWNNFANANPLDVLGGFNPVDPALPPPAAANGHGDTLGMVWGLFSTSGQFFSVQVFLQAGTQDHFRVAAVHPVQSMTLPQLQAL